MRKSLPVIVSALVLLTSCTKENLYKDTLYSERKVLLLYSAGNNSLSSALLEDINDLIGSTDFHTDSDEADAVLIYSHSKNDNLVPHLIYPHKDKHGNLILDTLVTYTSSTVSASAQTLNKVLTYVKENFPADSYGMVFSSHATGFLPAGYYSSSSTYESSYSGTSVAASKLKTQILSGHRRGIHDDPLPVCYPEGYTPDPMVKSIGQDYYSSSNAYEMDIADFADAIPMELEYLVFDACLMANVEVAYQLRDKVRWLIASPTEILSEGMDYTTMVSYLMNHSEGDFEGFCRNYYNVYNALSGSYQSATISLTDCSKTEALASVCANLFSAHRDTLDGIDYDNVQPYYRYSYHWFYDLGDIINHLGCTDEELSAFQSAMDACVTYKAATASFLGISIDNYSGLSMMIPANAGDYLKAYYTALDWNKATFLVE